MLDLEEVNYITHNYQYLQGLKMAPVGLLFILTGATSARWLPVPTGWPFLALLLVALVASILFYRFIGAYYDRTFGHVQPAGNNGLPMLVAAAVLIAVILAAIAVDIYVRPSVSVAGLALAALMFGYYWPRRRFAAHYLVMSGVIALVSLLPFTGLFPNSRDFEVQNNLLQILLGSIYLFGGIFDHLVLVRTMRPVSGETDGRAI